MKFALTNPDGWFEALRVGSFANQTEDSAGRKVFVAQVVQPDTLERLVTNWRKAGSPELLIDREHYSEEADGTTEAMGWLTDLRVENDRLLARARWSEDGERLLTGGAYRYCSVVLDALPEAGQPKGAGEGRGNRMRVRPEYLVSVALTNRPAVGGLKPISNRAPMPAPNPNAETMDLSKLATELKLPATATLEEITAAVVTVRNRADAADKASAEETITRLKNRIPAGQEQFFRDQLLSNRAATVALLESLPEQSGAEKGGGTTRVHNRDKAAGKTAPDGVKEGEDTPDLKAEQDKHLLELRNRMPSAKRADLVLQAMAEKPDIWPG